MKKISHLIIGLAIFAGAAGVSEVRLVDEARAECTDIHGTCSETEWSELDRELSAD